MIVKLCACLFVLGWASGCEYFQDQYSPFHWKPGTDLCTSDMCLNDPSLNCELDRGMMLDAMDTHYPENITKEIEYLQAYYDTIVPQQEETKNFHCDGACTRPQEEMPMIFHEQYGVRELCFVIGPQVRFANCQGRKCRFSQMRGTEFMPYYCAPDVTISMDLWIYCPDTYPSCIKKRVDIPWSCTCKKFACRKPLPLPAVELLGAGLIDPSMIDPTLLGVAANPIPFGGGMRDLSSLVSGITIDLAGARRAVSPLSPTGGILGTSGPANTGGIDGTGLGRVNVVNSAAQGVISHQMKKPLAPFPF